MLLQQKSPLFFFFYKFLLSKLINVYKFIQCSNPIFYCTVLYHSSFSADGVGIIGCHIVFTHGPTLFVSYSVQWRTLKEPSHEGDAVLLNVGLPSEGVEDGIGTAADESQGWGHCTAGMSDFVQTADTQNILDHN